MAEREIQLYTFVINVQSIKMKVKFPCKMKLEYLGQTLTSDVSQNDSGKFIFNHQVRLREDIDKNNFEITAHLITDKGSKYIAGVIKLMKGELINQQGQLLLVHLVRCLDSEALCQLRVDQVSSQKIVSKLKVEGFQNVGYHPGNARSTRRNDFHDQFSPIKNTMGHEGPLNHHGTKSEYQFPLGTNRTMGQWQERRSRNEGQVSYMNKNRSKLTFKRGAGSSSQIDKLLPEFGADPNNRDKLIEAEVYKESYQKLKQKYKKEADVAKHELNKRIALENNENSYKLQIMRLKLRCQEQEKSLHDKNSKIKQYQIQLANLQKKQLDLEYLREENSSKDHTLKMLQETVRTLNRDNEDLKNLNRDRFDSEQDKIRELRNQIDNIKNKSEKKIAELEKQIRVKSETLIQKDADIRMKEQRIQKQHKLINELENSSQGKFLQFERMLNNERNQAKNKMDDLKQKIDRLQKQKLRMENQLQESKADNEKIKSYIIKVEYDKKIMHQQSDGLKTQMAELRAVKEKYYELSRDYKMLNDEKNHLQRQYEKTIHSKDINLNDLTKQSQDQIEHYKKVYRDSEERLRAAQMKLVEIEGNIQQKKNQIQKMRKNNETLSREINDLREGDKSTKRNLKNKQEEYGRLTAQFQSLKQKYRNSEQMQRLQIDSLRDELGKFKRDLQSQAVKGLQFHDKNSNLNNQLNQLRLKIQYSEDQAQKNAVIYKEKLNEKEQINRNQHKKIEELNNKINEVEASQKQKKQNVQKLQIDILQYTNALEKISKQLKNYQEKVHQSETIIRNKVNEINNLQQTKQNMQKKLQEFSEKLNKTKNTLNQTYGENTKNEKIIEILNREIDDLKHENQLKIKELNDREKREEQYRNQIKKAKEENLKSDMKGSALKKQYQRFKQHVLEALTSSFSQLPGIPHSQSIESSVKKFKPQEDEGLPANQIINKISYQNRDIKSSLSKLIEHNKNLEKDLQKSRNDLMKNNAEANNNQQTLQSKAYELEEELRRTTLEKENMRKNLQQQINELNSIISEKDNDIRDLNIQAEELNFTINSIGMDLQSKTQHFDIKTKQFKARIAELEEKISFQNGQIDKNETKINELEVLIAEYELRLQTQTGSKEKKEKQSGKLIQQLEKVQQSYEQIKKQKKQLTEKLSEYQVKLNTEIQLKTKTKQLLTDEQQKSNQLKEFVSNLMKQKENAIKSELQKSERITGLEGQIMELNREKDSMEGENERLRKIVEEQKQFNKKLNAQIKDMQAVGGEEKSKSAKLYQRIRQRQLQNQNLKQMVESEREENKNSQIKLQKEIANLQEQLQKMTKDRDRVEAQMNIKENQFNNQHQQDLSEIKKLANDNLILEENIFSEKQHLQVKNADFKNLEENHNKAKNQIKNLEQKLHTLNEELKEKQQNLFQLAGKVYELQNLLEHKQMEKIQRIETTIDDWSTKYEGVCSEYDQRIALAEKQRSYYKGRLEQMEAQYRKVVAELKNNQDDDEKLKKALEQKTKRLQQDRLNLLTSKNSQIQRLAEQNKSYFDILKAKQADLRRLQHEVEIARATITKLEQSKKQTEQKIKSINKVYQEELEEVKKREINNRKALESIDRIQWDIERQIKKIVQNYSKKFISAKDSSQKLLNQVKGLENQMLTAISAQLSKN